MKIFAETERLILREILPSDADKMFELDSDPEVHRFLGNDPVKNINQITDAIQFIRQQYIDNGIGRWAIVSKSTDEFIGWAGLKFVTELTNHHKDYYDLGYRLIRKHWGNGYATEAAVASLKYAFEKIGTVEVFAMAETENINSINILKKSGFRWIEKFDLDGIEHLWFQIKKTDFENQSEEK
ncbi:MAG: GNAT family N-acetyltransferase [Flavobacteriia bacterium]|nr:GNAT family N-acetyltransferase [Flavobacteriia bacterium]